MKRRLSPTLRQELQQACRGVLREGEPSIEQVSTEIAELDGLFPGEGLRRGSVVEWLSGGEGTGAWLLLLTMARQFQRQGFFLVVIDPAGEFHPPCADQLGVDLERVIVVRPVNQKETLWALEQSLRCAARVVTVCPLEQVPSSTYRRLKLAAERGRNLGFFLRPREALDAPSWADLRLWVEPVPVGRPSRSRRLKVSVLAARGSEWNKRNIVLDIHDESGAVSVVSELDGATAEAHLHRAS